MKLAFFVAALAVFAPKLASANLLTNGSFEAQTVSGTYAATYGFEYLGSNLTGWTVTAARPSGIVLFNGIYQPVADGINAVQLEIPGDKISQTFATVIGQTYKLAYEFSAYSLGTANLDVTVSGASDSVSTTTNAFTPQSLTFVASALSTQLTFSSVGTLGTNYAQIDNVSVTAVPEPEGYALALAGLGVLAFAGLRRKA